MGLNKKDRRISIWIGIIIGVTLSSMLFRYAIKDKNERSYLDQVPMNQTLLL